MPKSIIAELDALDPLIADIEKELDGSIKDTKVFTVIETLMAQVKVLRRAALAGVELAEDIGSVVKEGGHFNHTEEALVAYRSAVEGEE